MLKLIVLNCLLVLHLDSSASLTHQSSHQHQDDDIKFEGKIIGGEAIDLVRVPYGVQIFNLGSMCAGTILNSWALITAAHCFDLNKDINEIVVQVGSRHIYDFNGHQYHVADLVTHKNYNQSGLFACDIAMVFLESPIEFSDRVQKTVLVNNKEWMDPKQTNFIVTGWGLTKYGGSVSKDGLMMTNLRFVSKRRCNHLHNITLSDDMFCLYGDGSRDTCMGDSGGGVFWNEMLVGITSHGDGCAKVGKPSVYSNVHYFRDWVRREMMSYVSTNCHNIAKPKQINLFSYDYFYDY